jgi:hypothetical protein
LDDGETWTSLLQQELNKNNPTQKVIIGNLGKSGVMAFDNYLHLKNYVPQLEDLKGVDFVDVVFMLLKRIVLVVLAKYRTFAHGSQRQC